VDQLLGRDRISVASSIDVDTVNKFFTDKVAKVCASTDNAAPPTYTHAPAGPSLREFSTLFVDIISGVRQLPDKSSVADPVPTFVLKQIIDLIAPFVTELFRRSLTTGRFPSRSKDASIMHHGPAWSHSSKVLGCRHTSTPTTPRFTAPVHHHMSTCFYQKSPTASPLSLTGCGPTAYNSTTTRRSSCGAQRTVANIFCPLLVLPASTVRDGVYIDSDLSMVESRPANHVALFCHSSPATHHPTSSPNHRVPVTGYHACSASLRLL